ncbi:MAG: N-6 DNA methylase [Treponema sp.]|nr:N-6 DNA methylase [Treponema sp.]
MALYTSEFNEDKVKFEYKLVPVTDDNIVIGKLGNNNSLSFKTAKNVKEHYKVWKEIYDFRNTTDGLFDDNISAYLYKKYTVENLKEVDNDDIQKKYHQFATILRKYNVSGRENAFDKLVNLFLAKIVDEKYNKNELAFYWKGAAYDDVKGLIDRLQKHYKIGMKEFLREDVTYIEKSQIEDAFKLFKNRPDATRKKILDYFDQLKYYTNNDFAFIDVHNEKLFYQNAEVLLEIVKMIQDIKLQTNTQNQFLGDLFEGFLDKGVKQSEGQFFTPIPIVKFLISSLPLQELVKSAESLQTIDYACGAGHFLNEYANQISLLVDKKKKTKFYKAITGIEKEYRLSKVAKVSAFMYGQDKIKIIYGDALAKNKEIKDGSFSILVANPPYSVKGFLETLDDESLAKFDLFRSIDDKQKKTNNSIECFFVERAKQLLKTGGVAAIILPSSILSNGNIYIKTREIILKYFDIVAIAEFGSGTFGKAGTNTVTLFLRKKDDNPDIVEQFKNCVDQWFNGDLKYTDEYVVPTMEWIDNYCKKINVSTKDYKTLLNGKPNKNLLNTNIFNEYKKDFENSAEYKNIQKKKITDKYTKKMQEQETEKAYIYYLKNIEGDKLLYFLLAESQKIPVVLVKSPTDSKAMKNFLGYEWSSAKGNEGIKYIGANVIDDEDAISHNKGINQIITPLFNPKDPTDNSKINAIIRNNFIGINMQNTQPNFVSFARLSDMIDFSRVLFDKAIKTTPEKKIEIVSKYELVKLEDIAEISRGASPRPISQYLTEDKNGINWIKIGDVATGEKYITQTAQRITQEGANKSKLVKEGDFIISNSMSVGRPYILKISGCIHDGWLLMSNISEKVDKDFLYYVLTSENVQSQFTANALGGVVQNLNTMRVSGIKIPLPPLDIQKQIITECEEVDREYNTSRMTMVEYKNKIAKIFENLEILRWGGGGGIIFIKFLICVNIQLKELIANY